jgi:hypothetical protein
MKKIVFINIVLILLAHEIYPQQIEIIKPEENSLHQTGVQIKIVWEGPQLSEVYTQSSIDSGVSWKNINRGPYEDTVHILPFYVSSLAKHIIRITEINNPDNYDEVTIDVYYPVYKYININNVLMWIASNGEGSHDPRTDNNGFYWPMRIITWKSAIYKDGLVFGGRVNGEIRVNGNLFRQGLQPGYILDSLPANPRELNYIWKIRKNWESISDDSLREEFNRDFNSWPADFGAPWQDINNDGEYTNGIDRPLFYGDEQLYYVANDLNEFQTAYTYGSSPIGLEFQVLTYAFDSTNFLNDVVFKRYFIINKSNYNIDEMLLSYWADNDMGDASDDYVGCDSTLNLAFTWNSTNNDAAYGTPPPSVGHMLVQGPIVSSVENDSAMFKGKWISGYTNLNISSFGPNFKNRYYNLSYDPISGIYESSLEVYNGLMRGLKNNGEPFINPHTNQPERFSLAGDPETGEGWYEGDGWQAGPTAGDRRYYLNFGTFNMAPGDTQEVVIAIFMALGSSNKNSVTALKEKASLIHQFYRQNFNIRDSFVSERTESFRLYQNYPNPFNSGTTIRYSLKEKAHVRIKLFDVLGKEITSLVDEEKVPWTYEVKFNPVNLSSGVYIYRIEAGEFRQSKKMILLR